MTMAVLVAAGALSARADPLFLRWQDNSGNESGFRVERSTTTQDWVEIAVIAAEVTSFADDTAEAGQRYSYRVRAFNSAGNSPFSNVASAELPVLLPANEPPRISAIADQSILAGDTTGPIPFVVGDEDTAVGQLTVIVQSSNPALVPGSAVRIDGQGASRTVIVTPRPDQSGRSTITLTVFDGIASSTTSFVVVARRATVPPTITQAPVDARATAGSGATLRVTATGEGPVYFQWYHEGVALPGATGAALMLPSAQRFHAGSYQVRVWSGGLSVLSETVELDVDPAPPSTSRLVNLSARTWCGTSENVTITGLVVGGVGTKQLLVRAVGPTLGAPPFDIPGVLLNPRLSVRHWNGEGYDAFAENLDWGTLVNAVAVRAAAAAVQAFPLGERSGDAALVTELVNGQYTIVANDETGASGVALIEVYDLDPLGFGPSLINLSNRGYVGSGADVMIIGFVVSHEGPLTVLLRAIGPGLAGPPFNLGEPLDDPVLEIFGTDQFGNQQLILSNHDWQDQSNHGEVAEVSEGLSAFALETGSRDAAMLATLEPGSYTAVVRGRLTTGSGADGSDSGRGIALMEIYTVP